MCIGYFYPYHSLARVLTHVFLFVYLFVNTHTHNCFTALWILSRTTRVSPIPEETFTHSHLSWSSVIPYLLHPSNTIHGILLFNLHAWQSLSTISPSFLWSTSAWQPLLHTPYISSPNHCLLFAAYAHTIATCFAVVPRLSSNPSLSLNPLFGTQFCSLMPHIHLTILISGCWSATSFSFLMGHGSET